MQWYWFAVLIGIFLPWVISGKSILIAFKEGGVGTGIAYWSGFLWLTVPAVLAIMWVLHMLTAR